MEPFIYLLLGELILFIEFYLPGGILATLAAGLIIFSIVLYGAVATSPLALALFILLAISLTVAVVYLALNRIKHTAAQNTLFLAQDQEGFKASEFDSALVGKEGIALSDLKPSGHVEVAGQRYQAISKLGYIEKGQSITILGGSGAYLQVTNSTHNLGNHNQEQSL